MEPTLIFAGCRVWLAERRLERPDGELVSIDYQRVALIRFLHQRPCREVSQRELLEGFWTQSGTNVKPRRETRWVLQTYPGPLPALEVPESTTPEWLKGWFGEG